MGFQIGIRDIIDIFLVAVLLFQMFRLLRRSGAANVFIGILAFIICWFLVSYVFRMELLGAILGRVVSVGAFALIVLFKDEIRGFLQRIGTTRKWSIFNPIKSLFRTAGEDQKRSNYDLIQIVLACRNLSKASTGALIVITRSNDLQFYQYSGEQINANINSRLIENIFFKNSPLHDGAMIISQHKIKSVACILPVSKDQSIPKRMGLRHRAALGITEQSDAVAIIVSEETGQISYAENGKISINIRPQELEHLLSQVID
jgi:diadenylate cyclase